jgi:hypothetical protein
MVRLILPAIMMMLAIWTPGVESCSVLSYIVPDGLRLLNVDSGAAQTIPLSDNEALVLPGIYWSPDGKWLSVDFGVAPGAREEPPSRIINVAAAQGQTIVDDAGVPYHLSAAWQLEPGACSTVGTQS